MAIDKGMGIKLPSNTRTKVNVPGQQGQIEQIQGSLQQQQNQQPVEITQTEDGGAEIDFDPGAMAPQGGEQHDDNLAEFLEDDILNEIGSNIVEEYTENKSSRQDWEDSYTKGLDLLGFKYENRSEPFQGASGATHPVLAEAVTQFQSLAYKELLPASGPVRTQVIGKVDDARELQAERVKEYMNYQLMVNMKEYEPEFDQMLFNLPLAGSTFKKVYYDSILGRCVSKFIPAEELVVPYNATSLEDADNITHSIRMTGNELLKYQVNGFYRDVDLIPMTDDPSAIEEKKNRIMGVNTDMSEVHTLLECHCELDIEGFEDLTPEGEATGIKLPYIVTVDDGTGTVLSIRRNFDAQDPLRVRRDYFVHFKFLP
ncbi:MAG TPA: hypothetical protein DEO86_19855, partial [Colwellia sp.]|nr:hypothetical protein [Colwellia sp.]